MSRRFLAIASAGLVLAASCGPSSTSSSGSPPDEVPQLALRYSCGEFPFGPELLEAGPGNAEQGLDPAAAALRAHLAQPGVEIDWLPDAGWHRTGMNDRLAEYIAVDDTGVKFVSVELQDAGWQVGGWGECTPRVALPAGLGPAEWAFDPDQPRPGPDTEVFDAMVTELSCNSGKPADGRIVGPEIVRSETTVLVIFAVRPRPGVQDCPSNPATRVTVDLGEPLGDRELLDGGRLPPGDPGEPRF